MPWMLSLMMSQAASFTKFRALKHESGTEGHAKMIVRIIACFQLLQTCQACQLLTHCIIIQNAVLFQTLDYLSLTFFTPNILFGNRLFMRSMDVKWPIGLRDSFINKFEHEWLLKHASTVKSVDGSSDGPYSLNPKVRVSNGVTMPTDFQFDNVSNHCEKRETHPLPPDFSSLRNSMLRSDGVICHTLKSCQADSNDVEIQMSEICQKRYVMFDHTGSKKRIIMHPSTADNFPALLSLPRGDHLGSLKSINVRDVSNMKETKAVLPVDHTDTKGQKFNFDLKAGLLSFNGYLGPRSFEINSTGQTFNDLESSDDFHENTEELDALMSSDYETSSSSEMSSTGHSPSEMTQSDTRDTIKVIDQTMFAGLKRKRALDGYIEKDTDDTATSGTFLNGYHYNNYPTNCGRVSKYGKDCFTVFDLSYSGKTSSCSSSNNERLWTKSRSGVQSRTDNGAKRQKENFNVLCDILPASESVGSALVLDTAVQLVKNLHTQAYKFEGNSPTKTFLL